MRSRCVFQFSSKGLQGPFTYTYRIECKSYRLEDILQDASELEGDFRQFWMDKKLPQPVPSVEPYAYYSKDEDKLFLQYIFTSTDADLLN